MKKPADIADTGSSLLVRTPSSTGWICVGLSGAALLAALLTGLPGAWRDARQRRITGTMVEIRRIGGAVESYAKDHGGYPSEPHLLVPPHPPHTPRSDRWEPPAAWPVRSGQSLAGLRSALSPKYIDRLPVADRWGHPYLYATTTDHQSYTIVSTGPDGQIAGVHTGIWYVEDTDRDLVYADGAFVDRLEGT